VEPGEKPIFPAAAGMTINTNGMPHPTTLYNPILAQVTFGVFSSAPKKIWGN